MTNALPRRSGLRLAGGFAVFLVATVSTLVPLSAEVPPGESSWISTGDSYSSGEGIQGNRGACAHSELAYGPLSAQLAKAGGWDMTAEAFTACTGHLIEDLFNRRPGLDRGDLWEWGQEQGAPDRADLITFSFGGNDVGFADIVKDCLRLVDSWTDYGVNRVVTGNGLLDPFGCETSEEELFNRIDGLLDPPRRDCTGGRHDDRASEPQFDCDLLISDAGTSDPGDDVRGSVVDFYRYVVDNHLTDRGHLVVVGYPQLFSPTDEWPWWSTFACSGVTRGDTERLNRLAARLEERLGEAVDQVNEEFSADRVHYVSRSELFRGSQAELCGTGADWLTPVTDLSRGDGLRTENPFHPNESGHAATAGSVTEVVAGLSFQPASGAIDATDVDVLNSTLPVGACGTASTGWPHEPIPLTNGEGSAVSASGDFGGASAAEGRVVGHADFDGDEVNDALLSVQCYGSLPEQCCAGRTSRLTFAVPFRTMADGSLELIGQAITGGVSGTDAFRGIQDLSLEGSTVVAQEQVVYPEQYSVDELGHALYEPITVTYDFDGQTWVETIP